MLTAMSRVTLAWECGEGYGHVGRLLPIARELRERGHIVNLVVRRLLEADRVFGNERVPTVQAPVFRPSRRSLVEKTPTYAGILLDNGYASPEELRPLHRGWQHALEVLASDLVLCDHAPTALLAARTLGVRRAILGSGFESPPREIPLPEMIPWSPSPLRKRIELEGRALAVINAVLHDAGERPLAGLADLFDADADFLCTFAELDHYGPRDGARYCGPIIGSFGGERGSWPPAAGRRVFVYLHRDAWDLQAIMTQLRGLETPCLVHIGGIAGNEAAKLGSAHVRVSAEPFDLSAIVAESDVVVSHGGHGTVVSTLLAGRPLLLVPKHPEQRLLGERVVELGAGLIAGYRRRDRHDYAGAVRRLLDEPRFAKSAQSFARRHEDFDPKGSVAAVIQGCDAILARA
jgi:UDP:flavonoid glycosyltransferase YjiC (YdhE family)